MEERGSALLIELGAEGVWVEAADHQVDLNVFFSASISQVATEALIQNAFTWLIPETAITICSEKRQEEEWQTAWQSHSIPIQQIGQRLTIVPPWKKEGLAPSDRVLITLSPGMAFGTGTHATTRTCLLVLEDLISKDLSGPLLDVGTGSGILAIAAAKLGVQHITATEIDPVALSAARENARKNKVFSKIIFRESILPHAHYTCVVANLTRSVLLELNQPLIQVLQGGGYLILSGMLRDGHEAVLTCYGATCALLQYIEKEDWVTLLMQKK